MKFLISAVIAFTSILWTRWGLDIASPKEDQQRIVRFVGWVERQVTRLDAALVRLRVFLIDRFELDRLAWEKLKASYVPDMS